MKAARLPDSPSPSRWRAFLRARFTREGAVGLYLTVGFFACLTLVVLFAALADSIVDLHGQTPLDQQVTAAIEEFHGPVRDRAARVVTFLGGQSFLIPSTVVVAAALALRGRRVSAVLTEAGPIETEVVVNAGGMFAAEIAALAGVNVPVVPMAHEYLITRPHGVPLDVPTLRDPTLLVYFRGESGGLVMGGYERHPAPWGLEGIPPDFNGKLLAEDWERFEELMTNALVRVPELGEAEVIRLVNGPEAFTPDGEFILGPTDVRGFWVAAGFAAEVQAHEQAVADRVAVVAVVANRVLLQPRERCLDAGDLPALAQHQVEIAVGRHRDHGVARSRDREVPHVPEPRGDGVVDPFVAQHLAAPGHAALVAFLLVHGQIL